MAVLRETKLIDEAATLTGTSLQTKWTSPAIPAGSEMIVELMLAVYSSSPADNVQFVRKKCLAKNVGGTVTVYQGTETAVRQDATTVAITFAASGTSVIAQLQDSVSHTHALRMFGSWRVYTPT